MQRIAVIIAIVTATVILPVAAQAQTKDDFEYWDLNGNSDLTCTEASGKDEGLKLPAYRDNRDGTGLIYEWLQRQRSSDTDNDGIACDSPSNPNGYVPRAGSTIPPPTNARECPAGSPTWMDLPVCEEGARVSYDRDAFGSAYSSLEDEIIDALTKSDGQVYTPYTCTLFDIQADGTAATDIEHIVALAEAYDSGLAESQFRTFAGDIDNLTIADPTVNRRQKSDLDAGEWEPPENRGWFAARIVAVKQKYGLSVNPDERDALQAMLNSAPSRTVSCGDGLTSGGPTYYFPHLAVGEGWQTTITYINYSPQEVTCQTDFISDHGTPLMVSFAALGTVVSRTDVLPPGGSVHQETNVDLNASLAPGWARATCSGPVQASLLYRLHNSEGAPTAEAGVNATAVPATRFVTFAEQGEDQFGTGVAYANPSAISVPVTFTARDGVGKVLASVVRTLSPGGHDAHGMAELFGLTSFTGSIEVTSTEPIVSLSLNFEADPVFSSLPPGETPAGKIPASDVPDLVVQTPSVSDSSPNAGESFMLSATVRNQGNGRSASTTLRYYDSLDATISTGDTEVGTDAVGSLTAAASSDQSISLTAPSTAGTYYYGACVDPVSGESATGNNCSRAVTVTVASSTNKPFNQLQTERLIGTWVFSYTIISEFTNTYRLSDVRES